MSVSQGHWTQSGGSRRAEISYAGLTDRSLSLDEAAQNLALPPDELQAWAESAALLDAGQVIAVASLAGVPASEIFKLVEVLLNYV